MTRLSTMLSVTAALAVAMQSVHAQPPARAPKPRRPSPHDQHVPPEKLAVLTGLRISDGPPYDNQPAVAELADGTVAVAWVRYDAGIGDQIVVALRKGEALSAPEVLTPTAGQYIRPVLAAAGADLWCFWTASEADRMSAIGFARRTEGKWSAPARFLPEEPRAHQNPEAAVAADGRIAVIYQVHTGAGYDIHLREWDGNKWIGPWPLSTDATSDWDPAVAYDLKGILHAAWCGFAEGDYDIYWKKFPHLPRLPDPPDLIARPDPSPIRLSARGEYDLHPSLAASPDGTVWLAWDVVTIERHGLSGSTTITGANRRAAGIPEDDFETVHSAAHKAAIEVRVIDGDTIRVPGRPRDEIAAPKGYLLAHCGLPKVACGPKGEPWIAYRALHRLDVPWSAAVRDGYLWEVLARPFRAGAWQEPAQLLESDGYLEEAAVASGPKGIRLAWATEHRRSTARDVSYHVPRRDGQAPYDHHRDFDGLLGWNGDVYLATLGGPDALGPEAASLPAAPAPDDRAVRPRLARDAGRHEVAAGGTTYRLLWGDTHRHSNISRCTVGAEPGPDDHYRYGTDICRYDFLALSDHSEYTTDYFWWLQQKLADLYHVPGFLSVLYNSEWSMRFPDGHHNTVFPSRPTVKLHGWLGVAKDLPGGWKVLETLGLKAVTIPHTGGDPGMGTTWATQDERYRRLCEIFQSGRGSYEHEDCPRMFPSATNRKGFYWRALEKGYHVGVIASSDHGYGTAYACVYAPANTREAVWQAMWDRRTYGSTTYGLVLEMRSGDRWMGEQWESADAPALDIYVRGAAPIRSVEILGRSKVLHAEGSVEKPLDAAEHRVRWSDPEWAAQEGEQWYYVRVIQTDDEMAWSSPVWVRRKR